jgi:hypothetical protein
MRAIIFYHASLTYFTRELPTSIEFPGDRFSEIEKRCLNCDLHCLKWKAEELQYVIKLESHMENSMLQKTV